MASRRQRSRKHAQRVQHQHRQRARLRAAIDSVPERFTMEGLSEHMTQRGYERAGLTGQWERTRPYAVAHHDRKGGPVTRVIEEIRKRKRRK